MWEHENETLQPKEYLYPPVSPSLSRGYTEPPPSKPLEKPTVHPVKAEESNKESAPKSAPKQSSSATPDVNYLFLAQLVVCLAVIGFVILMQKTNHEFYLQMGQEYKAALEQGVEITGDHDLLKFTEEAVAQVRDAAQEMLDSNTTEQGAGGWNPTSSQNPGSFPDVMPQIPSEESEQEAYHIQVGAFRNPEYAERLKNELLNEGFPAFVNQIGPFYKVLVGHFTSVDQAASTEQALRRSGYQTVVVSQM